MVGLGCRPDIAATAAYREVMDRPTTAQLVAIAVVVMLFAALVVGLTVLGGDEQQAVTSGSVSNTPPTSTSVAVSTAPQPGAVSTSTAEGSVTSTGPPNCETIPTLSLGGPDASVQMSLVFFNCGAYDADGEAMFDPGYVPEQPVVASGTVSLEVEPPGSIAIGVVPWEPGMTWTALEADVAIDPSPDGSYLIELPTTGCSAIVASLRLEPGEGRFVALAESALGACAAAA